MPSPKFVNACTCHFEQPEGREPIVHSFEHHQKLNKGKWVSKWMYVAKKTMGNLSAKDGHTSTDIQKDKVIFKSHS